MPDPRLAGVGGWAGLVAAAWMPWWSVSYAAHGHTYARVHVRLFEDVAAYNLHGWSIVTGALVVLALLLLSLRLLARSWHYEPAIYVRDVAVAAGLVAVALVTCVLWPQDVPGFWGTRDFGTGVERAVPGAGWWTAWAGGALAAYSAWGQHQNSPPPSTG